MMAEVEPLEFSDEVVSHPTMLLVERTGPRLAPVIRVELIEPLGEHVPIVELSEAALDRRQAAGERGGRGSLERILEIGQVAPPAHANADLVEPFRTGPTHGSLPCPTRRSLEEPPLLLKATGDRLRGRSGDRASQSYGHLLEEPRLAFRSQGGSQEFAPRSSIVPKAATQRPQSGIRARLGERRSVQEPVHQRQRNIEVPHLPDELGRSAQPGIQRGPGTSARAPTDPRCDARERAQAAQISVKIVQVLRRWVRPLDHPVGRRGRRRETFADVPRERGRRER